ncbi:MAG: hypothetical protein AAF362_00600 [Pseudomonadota bacterium]
MDSNERGICKVCGKSQRQSSDVGRPKIIDAVVDKDDGIARISQPKYKFGLIEHIRGSRIAGIASTLDGFLILTLVIMAVFLMFQPFSMDWRGGLSLMQDKGIEISALRTDQLTRNGKLALRVEGRITNNDSVRREIGDVTIVVRKPAGTAVRSWKHRPAMEYLEPGQSIRFISAAGSLPGRASRIEVSAAGYVTGVNM